MFHKLQQPRSASTRTLREPRSHCVRASVSLRTSLRSCLTLTHTVVFGLREQHLPSGDCGLCCTLSSYFLTIAFPLSISLLNCYRSNATGLHIKLSLNKCHYMVICGIFVHNKKKGIKNDSRKKTRIRRLGIW